MMDVKVHAPVLLIPTNQRSEQGIMVDLGSLAVQNTLLIPDQSAGNIGIDAYGITLNSFKISRCGLIMYSVYFAYLVKPRHLKTNFLSFFVIKLICMKNIRYVSPFQIYGQG